ncbi:universal stress protein [Aquicella lusitana]|uniref:Nucleotide-binding universal stress UspA family protein n=1 Tax=Aquicella lusitana TaxID=254246 RepID=A0A370GN76_9COXI|nr:universal stress protein [Aquicella lusitana]RDI43373.1 nucleotide-binding universal stress UspA family protein [Aquicella lusitana]VVC73523.1 Putative universal stress protein [Aquicella lusitana]
MVNPFKILFATDFSQGAKIAANTLERLDEVYDAEIRLIHVVESYWKNWLSSRQYEKEALERLRSWQKKFFKKINIEEWYIKTGNPADMIIQVANRTRASLILLGGRVEDELGRYKSCTTVESVVRFTKRPVWICKTPKVSRILCGIDGSSHSQKTLQFCIDLCWRFSAKLDIVHVMPAYLPAFGMSVRTMKQEEEKFKAENIKKIERFLAKFDFKGIKYNLFFRSGMPASVMLDLAEDEGYDLIAIGARGQSILRHILLGSTAEKILRYTPCSLLVVR